MNKTKKKYWKDEKIILQTRYSMPLQDIWWFTPFSVWESTHNDRTINVGFNHRCSQVNRYEYRFVFLFFTFFLSNVLYYIQVLYHQFLNSKCFYNKNVCVITSKTSQSGHFFVVWSSLNKICGTFTHHRILSTCNKTKKNFFESESSFDCLKVVLIKLFAFVENSSRFSLGLVANNRSKDSKLGV